MNAKDQGKLCEAGYQIFRRCEWTMNDQSERPCIKYKSKLNPDSWKKYGEYKSKAERDRKMTELMKDSKNIED